MKKVWWMVGVVGVLVVGMGAWRYWRMTHPREEFELPKFTELEPGPRAPLTKVFGVEIGRTSLEEVEALVKSRGLVCTDTSARALMKQMREKRKAEAAEKKARGEQVDAVSSASLNKKSPKEKNPQVRLTCNDIPSSKLGDRSRPEAVGRWLFIFDSPSHPLRHVSYRRMHKVQEKALADYTATLEAITAQFGAPMTVKGPQPGAAPAGSPAPGEAGSSAAGPGVVEGNAETKAEGVPTAAEPFPRLTPIKREWSYKDLVVRVNALNFGRRGVDILEEIEVPWPVRPDAPTLPPVTTAVRANAALPDATTTK